jgi:hypothetical protein
MAAGEVCVSDESVSDGSYMTIQPGSGAEWVIHNVYYGGAVEFYFYNGTNETKFDADATYGARLGLCLHATNSAYFRVKNISGGSIRMRFDGVQTK